MKRLAYIGQMPAEGTGSPVIVLRHLRRLAAHGWQITIIGEHGQDASACIEEGWTPLNLPLRRRWWPPFRDHSPLLRKIRTWLLGRECARLALGTSSDPILGYLAAHSDFSPEIAAHFARITGRPLTLLVHDDAAAFAHHDHEKRQLRKRHSWIMRQTHRCWFVSPELADEYNLPPANRRVLMPIPEGWPSPATWKPRFSERPNIYYAGFVWPPQYPLLAKLARAIDKAGGRLVLLSRETPKLRDFLAAEPADGITPFARNRDALSHLVNDAAGLLVSYAETTDEMPWTSTSFPSKFVEYSHLGIPCALVAPKISAIGQWAGRESYPLFFSTDNLSGVSNWVQRLKTESGWKENAALANCLAQGPFNPEKIHQTLEENLLR